MLHSSVSQEGFFRIFKHLSNFIYYHKVCLSIAYTRNYLFACLVRCALKSLVSSTSLQSPVFSLLSSDSFLQSSVSSLLLFKVQPVVCFGQVNYGFEVFEPNSVPSAAGRRRRNCKRERERDVERERRSGALRLRFGAKLQSL